jgi:hypothetical protein
MVALTSHQWLQLALIWLGLNLISAFRMIWWARRTGRRVVPWFIITFIFSAIPAAIVALCDRFGWLFTRDNRRSRPARYNLARCPHCHTLLDPPDPEAGDRPVTCSHCGLVIDEGPLA